MDIRNRYINPNLISQISNTINANKATTETTSSNKATTETNTESNNLSFQDILNKQADSIQFSKHASVRLQDRNISLSNSQIKRVEGGIELANQKGIKDSLVIVDDISLVVNVKNKFIITAMNRQNQNIFTNIDGTVIV